MNLPREEADQFFQVMLALQFYADRELSLHPEVAALDDYVALPKAEKAEAREALYAHPELLDRFVAENPAGLAPAMLRLVESWKHRREGQFFIVNCFKRHAIFISAEGEGEVYAVLGLYDPLSEVLYPLRPPALVHAVLLPFKGRIIYDGFLAPSMFLSGPSDGADLKEIYLRARRKGQIITTLEPGAAAEAPKPRRAAPQDLQPKLEALVQSAEALKAPGMPLHGRALSLLRASARLAQAVSQEPDDPARLEQLGRKVATALRQFETELNRSYEE